MIKTLTARYRNPIYLFVNLLLPLYAALILLVVYHPFQGDLVCFTREGVEEIPGCTGQGEPGDDYCTVRPYASYLTYKGNGRTHLGLCEGDYDNDDDCATSFYCFKRRKFDPVPGCEGEGHVEKTTEFPKQLYHLRNK